MQDKEWYQMLLEIIKCKDRKIHFSIMDKYNCPQEKQEKIQDFLDIYYMNRMAATLIIAPTIPIFYQAGIPFDTMIKMQCVAIVPVIDEYSDHNILADASNVEWWDRHKERLSKLREDLTAIANT